LAQAAHADDMGLTGVGSRAAMPYIGPGDAYAGATDMWSCVRPHTLAYALSGGNGCALVAASGPNSGMTKTFVMLPAGFIDVSSANAWAGTDVTSISCTSAATTLTCTGASSTPKSGDTFTGPGLTQPCFAKNVGLFTGGAGIVTTGGTGCGTFGSAISMTAQVSLSVQEAYDEAGSLPLVQNSSSQQPLWLPYCVNARPCLYSPQQSIQQTQLITQSNYTPPGTGSISLSTVAQRPTGTAAANFGLVGSNSLQTGSSAGLWESLANTGSTSTTGITDAAWHASFSTFGGVSAFLNIDGANTNGTASNSTAAASIRMNYANSSSSIYEAELILYGTAVLLSNSALVCANQVAFYGTPTGANCP
jgi:hypothetical protein